MRRGRSSSTNPAETTMRYAKYSPVSGRSSPVWIQCGSPARPLRDERAASDAKTGWPTFSLTSNRKNVGTAAIGYLQQLLPSQQAGVPQHVATVAARADDDRKRTAANANTSALSFITISFEHGF